MQGNCAYFEGLTIELLIEPLIYAYSSLITLISSKKMVIILLCSINEN